VDAGKPATLALESQELSPLAQPARGREALPAAPQRGCFGGIETVRRFRPFARRRLITARPPGVAMRSRNPCVLFRRLLLGW
jgi:hypothetical protein